MHKIRTFDNQLYGHDNPDDLFSDQTQREHLHAIFRQHPAYRQLTAESTTNKNYVLENYNSIVSKRHKHLELKTSGTTGRVEISSV